MFDGKASMESASPPGQEKSTKLLEETAALAGRLNRSGGVVKGCGYLARRNGPKRSAGIRTLIENLRVQRVPL